uniref:Lipocalin/cytosolic fatty-acid binding domain-containing protein n=1 Tax=Bos indicus x Bos taurus TaxID=30522 RepID=A0A4W2FMV6_BOBOX
MKAVFLTLLLGLVCAAQETPAETEASEITGDWNTIYMAVDNKEKIEQGGPLRGYIHHFECINNCEQLSVTFYVNLRRIGHVQLKRKVVDHMGENSFQVTRVSENMVLLYGENFDGIQKTKVTVALGMYRNFQRYEELNSERGIPNENIDDVTKTGKAPEDNWDQK